MLNKRMIHNNDFSFHILKLLSPEIKFRIFIKITHPIYLFNKMRLTNGYKTVNVNARKKRSARDRADPRSNRQITLMSGRGL